MIYLESYLALSPSPGLSNSLEELQALVLLCSLSLLRPTVPSLASLVDTAMRSATDLRLYSDRSFSATFQAKCSSYDSSSRRLAVRNQHLGRRLWWCAYSLDRLIAPWLGRPLSIPDDVVTTEIPHVDDDQSLSEFGFIRSSGSSTSSGYATHHHLKLRRLQSEIHCMLQSQHALRANASQPVDSRRETLTIPKQSGPFISWQRTMTDKLDEWRWSIPYSSESGRSSCDLLMELGYWQTIITLYRQIIIIPKQLVGLSSANEAEVEQLMSQTAKEFDVVYSRVAEASQKVIRIYRALQSMDLINIAYFAGDQIFIAGSLFLFTIWNSDHIRRCLSFQDIDSIVLTVTAVLDQMSDQSPTARISRTVFQQMSTTTIQYFLSTSDAHNNPMPLSNENHYNLTPGNTTQNTPSPFTFELTDHGKPQLPTLDFLEQADLSRDHKAGIWDDQLDKKDMFEVPIQLPFSFDGPDLLSQFAMGGQDSEALSKMPFGTNGLKREFQFTANDLDIDTAFAIPLNLQDEQSSDPDTPITGLSDELLRGLLVGWADP
ncbi:fungal specific transcription factor [Penicillium longicatenatum]|nr:fungal specific transcription factor [Penicillium longicatenatum]